MIDVLALWIGYAVLMAGGLTLVVIGLWECFELVAKRLGWTANILALMRAEAKRQRPPG